MRFTASQEAFAEAIRVMPGGVNSPARAFGAVGGEPIFIERAEGAYLFDGIRETPEQVEWMDNGEKLSFSTDDDGLTVELTGYPYGTDYCVRVAKVYLK